MTSLETIFNKCEKYNIFPNLDETFCYTPKRITKYDSKYIGSIYSITDINEIAECISEEGSCMLTYVIESKQGKEVKITNIFISLLIEFGFDPYVGDDNTNTVSIIITDKDVLGDDDDFGDDDVREDDDGDDDVRDDDEDDEVGDDVREDVDDRKDDDVGDNVRDDDVREDGDNVRDDDVREDGDNVRDDDVRDDDVRDDDVREDDVREGDDVGDDAGNDVVEDAGDDVEDDAGDDVGDDVGEDENVDDTFEKLKYITTLTKVQLLNLLLENKIYEYQNKNIRKLTKSDLQDCAKESIKLIKT